MDNYILIRSRCVHNLVAYRYSKCAKEEDKPEPNFNLGECRIVTFKLKWKINKNHISVDRLRYEDFYQMLAEVSRDIVTFLVISQLYCIAIWINNWYLAIIYLAP
jgi:hypothetical protein